MGERVVLTILSENTVVRRGLMAEHGFAVIIERNQERFLFDTGQGLVLQNNADKLGVSLASIDGCILSHGHWDHTDGLPFVLQQNDGLPIYAHPDIFTERYYQDEDGSLRPLGMCMSRDEIQRAGGVLHLSDGPRQIAEGIMLTGQVPRKTSFESIPAQFIAKGPDGFVHDELWDDQSLVLSTPKGLVLLLGCCHSGLINTLDHVFATWGEQEVYAVIGGTHLVGASEERMSLTINSLNRYNVHYLMPLHCTGSVAQARLHNALGHRFLNGEVGTQIVIE